MRLIKQLTFSAAIISLFCGCLFGALPAMAKGGQGAGGGNSSGRNVADQIEIEQAVYVSKFALKLALNQMLHDQYSRTFHDDAVVKSILSKPNLFDDLSTLKIHPQVAPCPYDGLKRDGDIHGDDVCISLGRLQSYQYSQNEILRKVTGLLGHEFAHKRGITFAHDSDADIMRDRVEETVPALPVDVFINQFTNSDLTQNPTAVNDMYRAFRVNAGIGLPQACASAAFALATLTGLEDDLTPFGSAESAPIVSPRSWNLVEASVYRIAIVTILGCGIVPGSNNRELSLLNDIFENMTAPISMEDANYQLAIASIKRDSKMNSQTPALTRAEFDRVTCDMAAYSSDCNGLKSIHFSKIAMGDLSAMKLQMFEAETEITEVEGELFEILREAHDLQKKYLNYDVCQGPDGWLTQCPSKIKSNGK